MEKIWERILSDSMRHWRGSNNFKLQTVDGIACLNSQHLWSTAARKVREGWVSES
jgi:hypothetical protein